MTKRSFNGENRGLVNVARTASSLPHDLMMEILSWLPTIDLWPLRCVCKPWFYILTTDPIFSKLHFDRSIQLRTNPSIIAQRQEQTGEKRSKFYLATDHTECDKAIELGCPFLHATNPCIIPIHGICNGLLCLYRLDKEEVYIWNPLINAHITIPCPLTPIQFPGEHMSTAFGFGFLQSTNEYKVIKLVSKYDSSLIYHRSQLSVYTLGVDSSWRNVEEDIPYGYSGIVGPSALINGVVHWIARKDGVHWIARKDGQVSLFTIVAFDVRDESVHEIKPPKVLFDDNRTIMRFWEIGGLLYLSVVEYKENIHIWTMKEYGVSNSWVKHFKIGRPMEEVGDFDYLIPIGGVAHSGDMILVKSSMKLMMYNRKTNSINYLKEFGFDFYNANAYNGGIISPRVISGAA